MAKGKGRGGDDCHQARSRIAARNSCGHPTVRPSQMLLLLLLLSLGCLDRLRRQARAAGLSKVTLVGRPFEPNPITEDSRKNTAQLTPLRRAG
eukprot:CAMPEP_0206434600 /NCGR_PEP_ID=MMETSP0324_2-20121206/9282_1 /ASSEMBLY_ACC=CAM_ASM_000836 /TAXON_ID=2866 /ORGANISM="Crypthecodinium cohnii, Strain Seligo" /LENGTH=92 /DNA_ID=CAMNT_0053901201 /DNA_START=417 /DNA_END=691 /DNA_ORIENTATION=-